MTETEPRRCPTCAGTVSTPYCPACGERQLRAGDLSLRGLFDQWLQAFTQIDGRLVRTVRSLVGRPGALTVAYLDGRRTPYVGPVALFLLANVLFFAAESMTGGRVFTTPLDSHLRTQPWSPLAAQMVAQRLQVKQTTLAAYAPIFNRAVALNARSLIIIMALTFVVVPAVVFYRGARPPVAHAVFSLHLYACLLLLLCVANAIPAADRWLGGAGFDSEALDHAIAIGLVAACAIYLYVATRAVYGATGMMRALAVIVFTVAVAAIVLGYRFALFVVTLYST